MKAKLYFSGVILCCVSLASGCRASGAETQLSPKPSSAEASVPSALRAPVDAGAATHPQENKPRNKANQRGEGGELLSDAEAPVEVKRPELIPLKTAGPLASLPVPGFRDAVVVIPQGIVAPRPVLVALHGNYDRPEWQCEVWGELLEYRAFILCPRGIPRGDAPKAEDRWTYGSLNSAFKEVFAGLRALRGAYEGYVDGGGAVLTGFSLGAIYAVHGLGAGERVAAWEAGAEPEFSHAVLMEGGYAGWTKQRVTRFAQGGGGVLFACGQHDCKNQAAGVARLFAASQADAKVVFPANIGHTYGGALSVAIAEELPWLFREDSRWRALVGAPREPSAP